MKSLRSASFLVLLGLASSSAFALAPGDRVGNGGDSVVTSEGARRLRDLVDPGTCTALSGQTILKHYPEINETLAKIEQVNPFFAYGIKQQISRISWCFTARLKNIDTNDDEESLTYFLDPYATTKVQAAIRVINDVYIDRCIVPPPVADGGISPVEAECQGRGAPMLAADRPFLFIHEAMHAFLPMKTPRRNQRVRNSVKSLNDLFKGSTDLVDLDATIELNRLLVPKADAPYQRMVKVLRDGSQLPLAERRSLVQNILDARDPNQARQDWLEISRLYSDRDLTRLTSLTGLTRFEFMVRAGATIDLAEESVMGPISRQDEAHSAAFGMDISRTLLDRRLFTGNFGRCAVKGPQDAKFWFELVDLSTGRSVAKLKARNTEGGLLGGGQWITGVDAYDWGEVSRRNVVFYDDSAAKAIYDLMFTRAVCDFDPAS